MPFVHCRARLQWAQRQGYLPGQRRSPFLTSARLTFFYLMRKFSGEENFTLRFRIEFVDSYLAHTLRVMTVFGMCPSWDPCLPELCHCPEAFNRFSNKSGEGKISSYFDHQTFTPTVDRPEPKFLNCIPALFTLATFHMLKLSSTGLVRLYCGELGAEKLSPATKGLLEE